VMNKADASNTASLLFQTGWSGRAEMGTMGSDAFAIKVSPDGANFTAALSVDPASGKPHFPQGATGTAFGGGEVLSTEYTTAKGADLVSNGTGALGSNYNFPQSFTFDASTAPHLPGAFCYTGYRPGSDQEMTEFLPLDPNQVYQLQCYVKQEALPGDWSGFSHGDRHQQQMGIKFYDADYHEILPQHHMRHFAGGVDSLTTLAAPLTPGDMVVSVVDASGWNDGDGDAATRGMVIYGYRTAQGRASGGYSRIYQFDLFDGAGVDKANQTIALKTSFPAELGNPEDPNGTWPAGTPLANTATDTAGKMAFFADLVLPSSGDWYHVENVFGGLDRSGTNAVTNFPPGAVFAKIFWRPNHTNVVGGGSGFPDTGPTHRVWFAGVSLRPAPLAVKTQSVTGTQALFVPELDAEAGQMTLGPAQQKITPVDDV